MSKTSQTQRINRDRQLIAGIEKHFGKGDFLVADGVKYKPAEILAMLKERIDVAQPVAPAKAKWMACVAAQEHVIASTDPTVAGVIAFLRVMHGASPELLADFGLAPKTRRELTVAEKAARADKARATRRIRHTMGKRQRERLSPPDAAAPSGATQSK